MAEMRRQGSGAIRSFTALRQRFPLLTRTILGRKYRRVLAHFDALTDPEGEACVGFAPLVEATGIERGRLRRMVRHLARRGFAEFHFPLVTHDMRFRGAGYCISHAGRDLLIALGETEPDRLDDRSVPHEETAS